MAQQHPDPIRADVREAYARHLERRSNVDGALGVWRRRWAKMARAGHTNATLIRANRIACAEAGGEA